MTPKSVVAVVKNREALLQLFQCFKVDFFFKNAKSELASVVTVFCTVRDWSECKSA